MLVAAAKSIIPVSASNAPLNVLTLTRISDELKQDIKPSNAQVKLSPIWNPFAGTDNEPTPVPPIFWEI